MLKIDLHVHSIYSYDGGVTPKQIERKLLSGQLDLVAITDHNSVEGAKTIQKKLGELGRKIIVGSEIMTSQGEIIGLYLDKDIAPNQTAKTTIEAIRRQNGIVYLPHPFETSRHGVSLTDIADLVSEQALDPKKTILETFNGRAYTRSQAKKAIQCAQDFGFAQAHSSDAHGAYGWGQTYTEISDIPSADNLAELLQAGRGSGKRVKPFSVLYPALNKIKKKISRKTQS